MHPLIKIGLVLSSPLNDSARAVRSPEVVPGSDRSFSGWLRSSPADAIFRSPFSPPPSLRLCSSRARPCPTLPGRPRAGFVAQCFWNVKFLAKRREEKGAASLNGRDPAIGYATGTRCRGWLLATRFGGVARSLRARERVIAEERGASLRGTRTMSTGEEMTGSISIIVQLTTR